MDVILTGGLPAAGLLWCKAAHFPPRAHRYKAKWTSSRPVVYSSVCAHQKSDNALRSGGISGTMLLTPLCIPAGQDEMAVILTGGLPAAGLLWCKAAHFPPRAHRYKAKWTSSRPVVYSSVCAHQKPDNALRSGGISGTKQSISSITEPTNDFFSHRPPSLHDIYYRKCLPSSKVFYNRGVI